MNWSIQQECAAVVDNVVASGLASVTCSIQQPDGLQDGDAGAPSGNYLPVAGLQGLICMKAPERVNSISATDAKTLQQIMSMQFGHAWLAGYYPQIIGQTSWLAVINGFTWDILGAEADSQSKMTRLHLRIKSE